MDRAEAASSAEQKARELFDSGDSEAQGLVQVLDRVKKTDQLPLYYSGGFTVLSNILAKGQGILFLFSLSLFLYIVCLYICTHVFMLAFFF